MNIKRRSLSVALALTLTIALGVFFVFAEGETITELVSSKRPAALTISFDDKRSGETISIELLDDAFVITDETDTKALLKDLTADYLDENLKINAVRGSSDVAFNELFDYNYRISDGKAYLDLTAKSVSATSSAIYTLNFYLEGNPNQQTGTFLLSGRIMPGKVTGLDSNSKVPYTTTLDTETSTHTFTIDPDWFNYSNGIKPEKFTDSIYSDSFNARGCLDTGLTGTYFLSGSGGEITFSVFIRPTQTETVPIFYQTKGNEKLTIANITVEAETPTEIMNTDWEKKYTFDDVDPGNTVYINLEDDMFNVTVNEAVANGLKLSMDTDSSHLTASYSSSNARIGIRLAANAAEGSEHDFEITLTNAKDDSDSHVVAAGTVTAAVSSNATYVTGFRAATATWNRNLSIVVGQSDGYALLPSYFTFNTTTPSTITAQQLKDSGINVKSISVSSLTADLVDVNGNAYLRITANANTSAQTYNNVVVVLEKTGYNPSTFTTTIPTVTVTGSVAATKINGIDTAATLGKTTNNIFGGIAIEDDTGIDESGNNFSDLDLAIGDEVRIYFDSNTFLWTGDAKPSPAIPLTQSLMNNASTSIRTTATLKVGNRSTSSTSVSPSFKYNNDRSYISLTIPATSLNSTSSTYELTVHMTYGSSSSNRISLTLKGDLYNKVIYVDSNESYVDSSNGEIIEAESNVSNVEIYAGNGVTLFVSRLSNGKLYQAYTTTDQDSDDDKIMEKHTSITEVIHLVTSGGLNTTATTVWIDIPSSYHVYNKNLEYLGTGSDLRKLPYSTVYYISTSKIDTGDDDDDDSTSSSGVAGATGGTSVVETGNGATPGGTTAAGNGNYNPGTGR